MWEYERILQYPLIKIQRNQNLFGRGVELTYAFFVVNHKYFFKVACTCSDQSKSRVLTTMTNEIQQRVSKAFFLTLAVLYTVFLQSGRILIDQGGRL